MKTFLMISVSVAILGGLFLFFNPQLTQQYRSQSVVDTVTVSMTANRFEPKKLTIQKGTKVIFKNNDTQNRWPAADPHPEHYSYPQFDSMEEIAPGQEWSFIFGTKGYWEYHDHRISANRGTIKVVEKLEK